jgi:hypothetical protein
MYMRFGTLNVMSLYRSGSPKHYQDTGTFSGSTESQVGHLFRKYDRKMLLRDSNAKVGRKNTFEPAVGNKSLHETDNDNGIKVVNFFTSENLVVKSIMFPYCKIHK